MTFGGGKCTIRDVNKEVIRVVPKTSTRVYKVEHEDIASGAEEHLTFIVVWDIFHWRQQGS